VAFRSIQDRWYVTDPATGKRVPSARHGQGMRYRARYKDAAGKEVTRAFADKEKSKAQRWLDEVRASQVTGTYVDPKTARTTVADWCETWLAGYATRRPGRFGRRRCTLPRSPRRSAPCRCRRCGPRRCARGR
jgi:hypothetical protein